MALTRKFLTALGLEAEKVDEIIQAHTDTVNGLKEQRDALKEDADKLPEVQNELKELKEQVAKNSEDPYEDKYNELKKEFDDYKADVEEKETFARKTEAYKALLKEAGVSDKRTDSVLKVSKSAIEKLEFDGEDVKEADKLIEGIKKEWGDFIVQKTEEGTKTATPPSKTGSSTAMTKKEIMAIKDGAERRKAIAENPEAFSQLEGKGE